MSDEEVDKVLGEAVKIVREHHPNLNQSSPKTVGMILKIFYSSVDKSVVDSSSVKKRAQMIWEDCRR